MSSSGSPTSSSEGGAPLHRSSHELVRCQSAEPSRRAMESSLVPYTPANVAPATFDDIRAQCHRAQGIIMRLQQATNNQVGLPGATREEWFDQLKQIGQCFITAQAASTQIERVVNSQRTQLENDLQFATSERDLAVSEKESAAQESEILRTRLKESREQPEERSSGPSAAEDEPAPVPRHTSEWVKGQTTQQSWGPSAVQPRTTPTRPLLVPPTPFVPRSASYSGFSPAPGRQGESEADLQRRLTNLALGTPSRQPQYGQPMGGQMGYHYQRDQAARMVSTPARGSMPFNGRRDTVGSSGYESYSSQSTLAPSASASNTGFRRAISGMPSRAPQSMAMTQYRGPRQHEDPTLRMDENQWLELIFKPFNMAMGWAQDNCSEIDPNRTMQLSTDYPLVWEYICQATYPSNRTNAIGHAIFMLNEEEVRPYFVARLLIQYMVQKMWSTEDWEGINQEVTDTLRWCRMQLANGHIAPHRRHEILQRQARAIQSIMNTPGWPKSKHQRVQAHVARLKDIAGPLLDSRINRAAASEDLHHIAASAWAVSARLLASEYAFQFVFNDCGAKFSFGSHRAVNSAEDPMALQTRQWRVMCVVTPGMTYRDDSGVSVTPRFLSKAHVLVMP